MTATAPPTPASSPEEVLAATEEHLVLTLAEAAAILRISRTTAKKLATAGRLPGALPKLGTQWRISRAILLEYVASVSEA